MTTHMVGTWSQHLAGRIDSRNGRRCSCHVMPDHADAASTLQEINQLLEPASKAAARFGGSSALAHQILLDVTNVVTNTAEQQGAVGPTYRALRDALISARDNPNPLSDVGPPPISPKRKEDNTPLTPRTAAKGLGATGAVPTPEDMWI